MLLRTIPFITLFILMFITFRILNARLKQGRLTIQQLKKWMKALLIIYVALFVAAYIAIEWILYLR